MMQRHPSCEGLDIGCFMVTPIQRIPRYVLLLKVSQASFQNRCVLILMVLMMR